MFASRLGRRLELDDIHVPLGLVENPQKQQTDDVEPQKGSKVYRPEKEKITPINYYDFLGNVLGKGNTKSKGKRINIIGEAGAGKTTQLLKIAGWILDNTQDLPIWISLGAVGSKPLHEYLVKDWLRDAAEKLDAVPPEWLREFEKFLQDGRVCLLLDGADEMGVTDPLGSIAQQLRVPLLRNVRVVMSCRLNLWDTVGNTLSDFDSYKMLDFSYGDSNNPDQVKQFIDKWFNTLEKEEKVKITLESNSKLGDELRATLDQVGKERIKDLARNPLRLSLLCFAWESGLGKLPNTKAELYDMFVHTLYELKKGVFPTTSAQRGALNEALEKFCLKAMDKGYKSILPHKFVYKELEKPYPELFDLADKLGWLNRVGVDPNNPLKSVYAFFHPTFQEYFAACAIPSGGYFIHHVPENPHQGTYRVFEPQWKEVILLWIGREDVESEQKEAFIKALVEFEDGCCDFYSERTFLFASAAIAEFKDCTFADQIVNILLQAVFGYFDHEDENHKNLSYSSRLACKAAILETDHSKVINPMLNILKSQWAWYYHSDIAKILSQISPGNLEAISALYALLHSKVPRELYDEYLALYNGCYSYEDFFESAAYSLLLLDPNHQRAKEIVNFFTPEIIKEATKSRRYKNLALHNFLPREYYRNAKAMANQVIPLLIDLMNENYNDEIRLEAANELFYLKCRNPKVITTLVELLKSQDEGIRLKAANDLLREVVADNPNIINRVIESLLELLRTSQNEKIRLASAKYLLPKIVPDNLNIINRVIESLLELLRTSQNEGIRLDAADYLLREVVPDNPNIINRVIESLLELLRTSQNEGIRLDTANYLLREVVPDIPNTALPAAMRYRYILKAESYDRRGERRKTVLDNSRKRCIINSVIESLLELLRTSQNEKIRLETAEKLYEIDNSNEGAVAVLIELSCTTQDANIFDSASRVLKKIRLNHLLSLVVTGLKDYVDYLHCYEVIWHCSQNMFYPDFYQAWHYKEGGNGT